MVDGLQLRLLHAGPAHYLAEKLMPSDATPLSANALLRLRIAGIVAVFVAVITVISGVIARNEASDRTAAFSAAQSTQSVSVISPVVGVGGRSLTLPGKLAAFYSAPIYARVPGYIHAWYKDIGAKVRKGDLLATIDTPELDQQIDQAKADLANTVAGLQLSKTTSQRWQSLLALDAVSKQETEEKTGDLAAKTAQVNAAQANLNRLQALKTFAKITAPFDGTVTDRSVDIGALVNAGAQSSGAALFTVADVHKIRVYVSVPQTYSAEIRPGLTASLKVPEYAARVFPATLDSTSNSISEQSDTLLVELLADNSSGALKPGDYAQVALHIPSGANALHVPASALIFRDQGLQVATVLSDNRIRMKSITIARDLGTSVEVGSGLTPRDRVVDNPPDSIANGDQVRVTTASGQSTSATSEEN
jgi:RND family efflux transporter MFP subunit